jgi:bifunctional non-homologous end joining protein LigD
VRLNEHKKKRKPAAANIDPAAVPLARKAAFPKPFAPQLATLVKEAPEGDDWLHEIKFDGYRILAFINKGEVRLISRNGKDWSDKFGVIRDAVAQLPIEQAVLDGEIVALSEDGRSDFQTLQNVVKRGAHAHLAYYVFDLPYCLGHSLEDSPLLARKELLELIIAGGNAPEVRYSDHIQGGGSDVYNHACRYALEGIISKRADAPYERRRGRSWVKVKCGKRQEFVIGGYTDPAGSRTGFGALLLGYYEDDKLLYSGRVGTGFNEATLKDIHAELKARERKTPPFDNPPKGSEARGVHWVTPELVGEVAFTEWTEDGSLRHPSFQGMREDKKAGQVTREQPQALPTAEKNIAKGATLHMATSRTSKRGGGHEVVAGVTLSNPDRVMYPGQDITKHDLALFYESIAEWVLPHVVKRPLSVVRCPQGHHKECFYQKHVTDALPDAVHGVQVEEEQGSNEYILINDLKGLISLVQMGVLEIHPWGSRADSLERPDLITFDLDPDPDVPWEDVVNAAKLMRAHLENLGLESYVKTSGGKGLHVVVPLIRRAGWDEVKAFAKAVATDLLKVAPDKYLATASKAKRKGKVFIDYLRNMRGATAVAAYSTRARAGAPVATPLSWEELSVDVKADTYTLENVPRRLHALKADPWEGFFKPSQQLTKTILHAAGVA